MRSSRHRSRLRIARSSAGFPRPPRSTPEPRRPCPTAACTRSWNCPSKSSRASPSPRAHDAPGPELREPVVDQPGNRLEGGRPIAVAAAEHRVAARPRARPGSSALPRSQSQNWTALSGGVPLYDEVTIMTAPSSGSRPANSSSGATVAAKPWARPSSAIWRAMPSAVPDVRPVQHEQRGRVAMAVAARRRGGLRGGGHGHRGGPRDVGAVGRRPALER